jgi:hypothetical protein
MFLSIIILKQMRVKMTHYRFWSSLKPKGFYEIYIILRSVTGYTRLYKMRSEDIRQELENTRRETQIQTKLDQPTWKNGQLQTPTTRPHLQTLRKNGSRMPPGNDGNASMPEQVKRPNPWRKMIMMMSNVIQVRNHSHQENYSQRTSKFYLTHSKKWLKIFHLRQG